MSRWDYNRRPAFLGMNLWEWRAFFITLAVLVGLPLVIAVSCSS